MAIARHEPDLVVIEDPFGPTRKYGTSLGILYAIAQDLGDSAVPHRLVKREQAFANKYVEAQDLAQRFPQLAPWLPKSRLLWETETTETLYFEALAIALNVPGE